MHHELLRTANRGRPTQEIQLVRGELQITRVSSNPTLYTQCVFILGLCILHRQRHAYRPRGRQGVRISIQVEQLIAPIFTDLVGPAQTRIDIAQGRIEQYQVITVGDIRQRQIAIIGDRERILLLWRRHNRQRINREIKLARCGTQLRCFDDGRVGVQLRIARQLKLAIGDHQLNRLRNEQRIANHQILIIT